VRRYHGALIAVFGFAVLSTQQVKADGSAADVAVIASNAFQSVPGSLHVNEAAGNANAQGNLAVVSDGAPIAVPRMIQHATTSPAIGGASASIRDFAFAAVSGLVQINQTAGSGNAQGNLAIVQIAVPAHLLSDETLAGAMPVQTVVQHGSRPTGLTNTVGVDASALHGKGIVQINQTAGSGNATANGFLLQVSGSATH
jgi:hypothetical protein